MNTKMQSLFRRVTWMIPNTITGIGLIGALLYMFSAVPGPWMLPVYIGSVMSDVFDGFAARCLKRKTTLGAFIDPLRDRVISVGIFVQIFHASGLVFWDVMCLWTAVVLEVAIAARNRLGDTGVHDLGKMRMAIHMTVGAVFTGQTFSPEFWSAYVSPVIGAWPSSLFVGFMLGGSVLAFVTYKLHTATGWTFRVSSIFCRAKSRAF